MRRLGDILHVDIWDSVIRVHVSHAISYAHHELPRRAPIPFIWI